MSFWSGIGHFVEHPFGLGDNSGNPKKKKQLNPQAQQQSQLIQNPQVPQLLQKPQQPQTPQANPLGAIQNNAATTPALNLNPAPQPAQQPKPMFQKTAPVVAPKPAAVQQPQPTSPPPDLNTLKVKAQDYQDPKVQDVGGYYAGDLKALNDEINKGANADPHRVVGLMQSLDNRKKELSEFHGTRAKDASFTSARELGNQIKSTRGDWTADNAQLASFWDAVKKNEGGDFNQFLAEKKGDAQGIQALTPGNWKSGTGLPSGVTSFQDQANKVKEVKARQQLADETMKHADAPLTQLGDGKTTVQQFLDNYNAMNPTDQLNTRQHLTDNIKNFQNDMGHADIAAKRDQSAIILNLLDDRAQNHHDLKAGTISLFRKGGDVGDSLGASTVRVKQAVDALTSNRNDPLGEYGHIWRDYDAGKLSKEEFVKKVNQQDNAQGYVNDLNSPGKRLLAAAGTSADVVSTFLPAGSVVKGAKAGELFAKVGLKAGAEAGAKDVAEKTLGRTVAEEAAANATASGVGSLRDGNFNPADTLEQTAIGGTVGAVAPVAGKGVRAGVSKLFRRGGSRAIDNTLDSASDDLTRAAGDEAGVASQAGRNLEEEAQQLPAHGRTVDPITEENLTAQERLDTHTSNLEDYTKAKDSLQQAAQQRATVIANSPLSPADKLTALQTARQQFQDAMSQIDANIQQSQVGVDNATADLKAGGDAAQSAAAATQTDQAASLAPTAGTTDAAGAGASPEVAANNGYGTDTIEQGRQAAEAARGEKPNIFKRFVRTAKRELYDPQSDYANLDRELAKSQGVKYSDLGAERRLTQLHSDVVNSGDQSSRMMLAKQETGQSLADILRKYGVAKLGQKSPEWARFNQFLNQRFALEVLQKSTEAGEPKWILGKEFDPRSVAASVEKYATDNADALGDAATVKQWADKLTDLGTESGEIDPEFANFIKTNYTNYVPLSRTYSDDLVRPKITGGTGNSVGQQNVVRYLAGSTAPLNDEAGAFLERANGVVKKANENRFVNELLNRQKAGLHSDRISLEVDPDVSRYNKEVSDLYDQAKDVLATSRGELKDMKGKKRIFNMQGATAKAQKSAAEAQSAGRVRQLLTAIAKKGDKPGTVADAGDVNARSAAAYDRYKKANLDVNGMPIDQTKTPDQIETEAQQAATDAANGAQPTEGSTQAFGDVAPYANNLTDKQALQLLDVINQYNPEQLRTVVAKIEKSNSKLAGLTDAVSDLQDRIASHKAAIGDQSDATTGLYEAMQRSRQKVGTGQQVLQGFRNGDKFALGIDPQMADTMAYLREAKDDALGRFSQSLAAPLKTVATGALSPIFAVTNKARNELLKFTNTDVRRTYGGRAIVGGVQGGLFHGGQFYKDLVENGYRAPTATEGAAVNADTAQHLASRSSKMSTVLYNFNPLHPVRSGSSILHTLNQFGGRLDNIDRVQIARGEYQHWLNKGVDPADAMKRAVYAGNNALGDFQNISKTARRLEAFTPYSGATQAGYRSLVEGFRARPVGTALKVGAIAGTVYGLAANNLQSDAAQEYYNEAVAQGRTYDLDSHFMFVLPGAHRDPDGTWHGIVKVPVAPDFQPLTRTAWRTAYTQMKGQPVTPQSIAEGLGEFATGDYGRNLYQKGSGAFGGALPSNPIAQYAAVAMNVNPQNGQPLATPDELKKGYNTSTSTFAINASKFFGGKISPLQIDALANTQSFAGDVLQNKAGSPWQTTQASFGKIFGGSKTQSDKAQDYLKFKSVRDSIPDDKQRALFDAIHTSRTYGDDQLKALGIDPKTVDKSNSGMLDGAIRAQILLGNEQVLKAEEQLTSNDKKEGKPANPLYDTDLLTPQERNAILTYRQGKIYNSAGQNQDKNGQSAFTDLGLDEAWYDAFKKKEDAYYDSLPKGSGSDTAKTFSGYTKPKADDKLQAKLDYYYTLPKGTGDRSRFLTANKDVTDYWAGQNDFTNAERTALGFNQEVDGGSGGGSGYGGGGNYSPYGTLNSLTDFAGNTTPELKLSIDKKAPDPDIYAVLRKLFAPSASSVSSIKLGAGSRGDISG